MPTPPSFDDEEIFARPNLIKDIIPSQDEDDDEVLITPNTRNTRTSAPSPQFRMYAPTPSSKTRDRVKISNDTLSVVMTAEEFVIEDACLGIAISAHEDAVHVDLMPEAEYTVECRGRSWHCIYFGPTFTLHGMRMLGLTIVDPPDDTMPTPIPEDEESFVKSGRVVAGVTPTEDGEHSEMVKHGQAVNSKASPVFSDERLIEIADTTI